MKVIVSACPEVSGGLPTPRPSAEIVDGKVMNTEGKNICCFCNTVFDGDGNSTWPIYYKEDGETHRCCDDCNEKYVIAARSDRTLIMKFRKQFGIDYTEYKD